MQVAHTALTPISEVSGRGGSDPRAPRRSLRAQRPPPPQELNQPRRYTMQLQASESLASGPPSEHRQAPRRSWRRDSSIKSAEVSGVIHNPPRLENSYRTGPARPFQREAAETVLKDRLAGMLRSYHYNALSAPNMTSNLTQDIKNKVKQELSSATQRYKLVVLVTIAEPSAPLGICATRALCSADTGDSCAKAEFRNSRVAAYAAVFAFYCE